MTDCGDGACPLCRPDRGEPAAAQPVEFRLSLLPDRDDEAHLWEVTLEYWPRAGGWVVRGGLLLVAARDGTLSHRPDRETADSEEWRAAHLLEFGEALEVARRVLPTVTVNGVTAAQHHENWIGWEARRRAESAEAEG